MKGALTSLPILAALGGSVLAAAAAPSSEPKALAGTRMSVDWAGMVSAQDVLLNRLPASHGDSLRLGNGDIGVAVCAVPECLVLFVGKNDLLDYRTKPLAHSPEATARSSVEPLPVTREAGGQNNTKSS